MNNPNKNGDDQKDPKSANTASSKERKTGNSKTRKWAVDEDQDQDKDETKTDISDNPGDTQRKIPRMG